MMPESISSCDVLVVGGGPAGSSAASVLAEQGYRVVVLEKARHPRFHIGESLLPANLPLLEELGVGAEVRAIGMEKWGAEFISPSDGRHQEFSFSRAWDKSLPMAYHVRRSEFDHILIRRAAARGARVIEGCRVHDVEFRGDAAVRVHAEHDDGRAQSFEAARIIDASGRDTFLGSRLRTKRRNKKHNSAAMFAHYTGARRECGKRAGNITVYWFDHGWFWFIPLVDGATSIGAVVWPHYLKTRTTSVREFFLATIAMCPPLAERLRGATLISEVEATGNYSYSCDHSHGENYFLIGDAYTFIDPVFSSGVMLAMNSGIAAAEAIHACRTQPATAKRALKRFDRIMRHGPKQFSWFIYRVTNPTMREAFLGPRNILRMEEALLSLLAGDIFGRTPIWTSLRLFKAVYYLDVAARMSGPHAARGARPRRQHSCRTRTIDRLMAVHSQRPGMAALSLCSPRCAGAAAAAKEEPLWEIGLGAGGVAFEDYRGSNTVHAYPIPVPYFLYNGKFLKADRDGVRGTLFNQDWVELNLSGNATTPVRNDRERSGMPDLRSTVEVGPSLDLHLLHSDDSQSEIRFAHAAACRHDGGILAENNRLDFYAALQPGYRPIPAGFTGWNLGLLAGPLFADHRYHEYFYSVAPQFATATRPVYQAAGGYAGTQAIAALSKRFPRSIGWAPTCATILWRRAVFDESPLVQRKSYWSAGFGISWIIHTSAQMVEVPD